MNFKPKPLVLIILDGWGIGETTKGNAIAAAKTPNMDTFLANYPHIFLGASGESVGLPEGQMGNSEVGHLNIGAGRVVYQDYARINRAIKDGSFFSNEVLLKAVYNAKKNNSSLHLMGLLSDGGVHSSNEHIYALLKLINDNGLKERVFLHLFLDGRDVPPQSALKYVNELEQKISKIGIGKIATIAGRYYGMDRDKRWDRTKLAYDAMVYGRGEIVQTPEEAIEQSYEKGIVDEFVKPTVIQPPGGFIKDNDTIVFFNFRPDRARQITRAFIKTGFDEFDRGKNPPKVFFVCMTKHDATFDVPIAFPTVELTNVLADILSKHDLKQLHIAETEKYAHVTFFFNGGVEEPKEGEDRILIPSPKIATYDLKPEMSAYEVTDAVINEINKDLYDVIILNFANPDMVGHTGVFEAAVRAIEAVDKCVKRVVESVRSKGGECIIAADHGNADRMIDLETAESFTAHTTNPVPFIYVTDKKISLRKEGVLADIAPTMLEVLGIPKPKEMTGKSLIVK
ncbi:MAG TPA: 2,3-bisphosphoglycerate-independent phosphoglycerate mutase [Actinobacteria bacterium]|nr:2,3-bisphosphoglycerate-independent phosphoglycerate mutase [Actinomycetota bacterium]